MTTTTEDQYYSPTFNPNFGEISTPQFEEDIEAIRQAEKKLNREGNTLTGAGLIAFGTGLALLLLQGFGVIGSTFPVWGTLLAAAGIGAAGFGLLKILGKLRKKSLDFPLLKKIKKAVRQQRSQTRSQGPPVRNATTAKSNTGVFEETYVRNKLTKSNTNKVFMGVCGGIAEYAGISPSLMRLVFLIGLMLSAGVIIPVYLILAIFLPNRN